MIPLPAHFNNPTLYSTTSLTEQEKNQNALLTLSGGQDSSLVGWILFQTQYYYLDQPVSLHYQHFWQQDTLYTNKHCSQLSFWFNWETVYYQSTLNAGTEKKARDWRETTNWRLTTYYLCTRITKGLTLTDRYETLFSHLLHPPSNKNEVLNRTQSTIKPTKTTQHYDQRQKTALFVQHKNQSGWILPRHGHKLRVKTKLYYPLKYGD
jgi:PP-loop family